MTDHDMVELTEALTVLIERSRSVTTRGCGRSTFLGDYKPTTIGIGKAIHKTGGFSAMQLVLSAFMDSIPSEEYWRKSDARCIEYAWDGIGDWLA